MKLDNKGWGLKEMLILTAILVFFFSLSIYFIYIFYDSISKEVISNNSSVVDKEYYEIHK